MKKPKKRIMNQNKIQYFGIRTNNLKNIDFSVNYGDIIAISGPSGSGKSSLAIDTIYKISEDELMQLMNRRDMPSNYLINTFHGILPSICLEQENFNANPRSSIATYFGIDLSLQYIFSILNNVSPVLFQYNRLDNACPKCRGIGSIPSPDVYKILDAFSELSSSSFYLWRNIDSDFYRQTFEQFCYENHINYAGKTFFQLSKNDQHLLLTGKSESKRLYKYIRNEKKCQKTSKYIGPLKVIELLLDDPSKSQQCVKYCSNIICPNCKGGRFGEEVERYKVNDLFISQVYTMSISEILEWVNICLSKADNSIVPAMKNIRSFMESACLLQCGYLSLGRGIPSLSGGELQRLRLAKACQSEFSNILYVLDEPTAGIHPQEWSNIAALLLSVSKKNNTIIAIEHNPEILKIANKIYFMGPKGGKEGGEVVPKPLVNNFYLRPKFYQLKEESYINDFSCNNVHINHERIPLKTLVGICGVSGSGKSSFGERILTKFIPGSTYLSQAPIRGNVFSLVATALGIMVEVQKLFAQNCSLSYTDFSFSSKSIGQCPACGGCGAKKEGSSFLQTSYICPACSGKRFSEKILKYKYNGYNIYEFLSQEIYVLHSVVSDNSKIKRILLGAIDCGLGYLTLSQETSSLSGGEAQRVKLVNAIFKGKNAKTFILDEPFRGVDAVNIKGIIKSVYSLLEKRYSFFIIEHNLIALSFCSYIIELGPGSGINGGSVLFNGETRRLPQNSKSIIAPYLVAMGEGFFSKKQDSADRELSETTKVPNVKS